MNPSGMRAPRWLSGAALVLLLLPLAACTGGSSVAGTPTPAGSPGPATSATTTPATASETSPSGPGTSGPEPSLGPSFPAGTSAAGGPAQSGSGSAPAGATGVSIQMDTHPGYGRVELVLNTPGVPAWTVAYSDTTGPGGAPVDIAGDAFLRVTLATGSPQPGQGSQGSSSVSASGVIAGVRTLGVVGDAQEVLIGVSGGRLPFRAVALTDPGRIVIDVHQ